MARVQCLLFLWTLICLLIFSHCTKDDDFNLTQQIIQLQKTVAVLQTQVQSLNTRCQFRTASDVDTPAQESTELKGNLKKLSQKNEEMQREIDELKLSQQTKHPIGLPATNKAFQVSTSYPFEAKANVILKFNYVQYNAGGCYNNQTGIFTAPTDGTYMFWATALYSQTRALAIRISHGNGTLIGYSYGQSPLIGPGVANGVVACGLLGGDTVHFSLTSDAELQAAVSSYGGALLHPR